MDRRTFFQASLPCGSLQTVSAILRLPTKTTRDRNWFRSLADFFDSRHLRSEINPWADRSHRDAKDYSEGFVRPNKPLP